MKTDSGAFARLAAAAAILLLALGRAGIAGADEAELTEFRTLLETSGFPENDETRRLMSDSILAPAYPAVESPFRINRQLSDGRLVQFELRKATGTGI